MRQLSEFEPTAGEQEAFSAARELARQLREDHAIPQSEVGKGFLVAAVNELRKSIGEASTAEILYEYADDYAVRPLNN